MCTYVYMGISVTLITLNIKANTSSLLKYITPRVNNEGKRVSNALYTLYEMFSESHVQEFKN